MRSSGPLERGDKNAPGSKAKVDKLHGSHSLGKLYIVSLGPGFRSFMLEEAARVIDEAEVVLGYKTYLELIEDLLVGKKVISSGMRKEVERCGEAIDHAISGKTVALVSSGDAGIYGMAGLVLDICRERGLNVSGFDESDTKVDFTLKIIPGIAAFNAAASLVGAPLMHDFAAVSLSDHLTQWELIEKRLLAAAQADFVLAIYNPRSRIRQDLLERARSIILRERSPQTPVAVVRRAMRQGQWKCVTTLDLLPVNEVDMQSVVIVGNSRTYIWKGWMITPRGYLDKYSIGA